MDFYAKGVIDLKELEYLRNNTMIGPVALYRIKKAKKEAELAVNYNNNYEGGNSEIDTTIADALEYEFRMRAMEVKLYRSWVNNNEGLDLHSFVESKVQQGVNAMEAKKAGNGDYRYIYDITEVVDQKTLNYLRHNTMLGPISSIKVANALRVAQKVREYYLQVEKQDIGLDTTTADALEYEYRMRAMENKLFHLWEQDPDGLDLYDFVQSKVKQDVDSMDPKVF